MLGEGLGSGVVEMPSQSGHSRQNLKRLDIEVRALTLPRFDDGIDVVHKAIVGQES
jgi:hypothetical protein